MHSRDSIIVASWTLVSAPMALYQYFKPVSKSLPNPEGLLSETLPSATIKAANEAVLAASKEQPCVIQTFVTIYKSIIINNCTEFFKICNLRNFNSSKFKFCLSCENFCFENNLLYGMYVCVPYLLVYYTNIFKVTVKRVWGAPLHEAIQSMT